MSEVTLTPSEPGTYATRAAHGAASELRACAALMDTGYHVFRCESPHAPFDLVAYRDGACLRVEVRSVTFADHGAWAPSVPWPRGAEWDLLAVVGTRIWWFDSSTSAEEARDALRAAYGFEALAGRINPMNKLTFIKAEEIRRRAASGEALDDLAKTYGISPTSVRDVVRGKTWIPPVEVAK